jgi:hypothetical protein
MRPRRAWSFNSVGGGDFCLKKDQKENKKLNGVMHINKNGNAIVLAPAGVGRSYLDHSADEDALRSGKVAIRSMLLQGIFLHFLQYVVMRVNSGGKQVAAQYFRGHKKESTLVDSYRMYPIGMCVSQDPYPSSSTDNLPLKSDQ